MSTRQKAPNPPHTWRSGFCGTGWHHDCRITYGPTTCACTCHLPPPAEPALATCPTCGQDVPRG